MKETGLLFKAEMVRATLAGRKTMTRRMVKLPRWSTGDWNDFELDDQGVPHAVSRKTGCLSEIKCPYGKVGDRLWVRESAFIAPPRFVSNSDCNMKDNDGLSRLVDWVATMDSDAQEAARDYGVKITPSIFMPRWASRITLEITGVRVERLQEITVGGRMFESDARKEGCPSHIEEDDQWFIQTWDSINAKRGYSFASNPLVWVLEFVMLRGGK